MLDPDGVWTDELFALMLPVAIEREADQAEAMFGAFGAAAAGLFGKEAPQAFSKGIEKIRKQVRDAQKRSRGIDPYAPTDGSTQDPAEAILGFFKTMGTKIPYKRTAKKKGKK